MSSPPSEPPMSDPTSRDIDWPTCTESADCIGRQIMAGGPCLAHANDDQRAEVYRRLAGGAPLNVAAGVTFTEELLAELRECLPHTDGGGVQLHAADFRYAKLPDLNLGRARFISVAMFGGAQIVGKAEVAGPEPPSQGLKQELDATLSRVGMLGMIGLNVLVDGGFVLVWVGVHQLMQSVTQWLGSLEGFGQLATTVIQGFFDGSTLIVIGTYVLRDLLTAVRRIWRSFR